MKSNATESGTTILRQLRYDILDIAAANGGAFSRSGSAY